MEPAEIVGMVGVIVSILVAISGGLAWVIKAQMAMQREFKPNGGSSTRDALVRIERDVRDIRHKVDDHIKWHMDN